MNTAFVCVAERTEFGTTKTLHQGFPNGVNWWDDNLGKMAKNCMKITKSVFWGQNSGGWGMGGKPILWVVEENPPQSPLRESLCIVIKVI